MKTTARWISVLCVCAVSLGMLAYLYLSSGSKPATEITGKGPSSPVVASTPVRTSDEEAPDAAAAVAADLDLDRHRIIIPTLDQVDFAAIEAMHSWTAAYVSAPADKRAAMEAEGIRLAQAHRAAMKTLIKADPQQAIGRAIPMVQRQELPASITSQIEQRVSTEGEYILMDKFPVEGYVLAPNEVVEQGIFTPVGGDAETTCNAYTYGKRKEVRWWKKTQVWGVSVDKELAIAESPMRPLEAGERIDASALVQDSCPKCESGSGPVQVGDYVTSTTPVGEVAGKLVPFCSPEHQAVFEQEVTLQAIGGYSGVQTIVITGPNSSKAIGNFRILYVRVTFPDHNSEPGKVTDAEGMFTTATKFFQDSSYGQLTLSYAITPTLMMPHTAAWYLAKDAEVNGLGLMNGDARVIAKAAGFNPDNYDVVVARYTGGVTRGAGGWGGGGSIWMFYESLAVLIHEAGHTFGLGHANNWNTNGQSVIGVGNSVEYGSDIDVMGYGYGCGERGHYSPSSKYGLKWMSDRSVDTVTRSGTYRIYAFDQPVLDLNKRYALKIAKNGSRTYWVDLRSLSLNSYQGKGANLQWGSLVLDTTPGSADGKSDAPIALGRTFSDTESGIHITTVGLNRDVSPPYLDMQVNIGDFSANHAPVVTLTANNLYVPVNSPVTFTASATDADGDALAYSWTFGDTAIASLNQPSMTRSYSSAGQYNVSCVVSDMKGGSTRRNLVVTVGAPSVYQVAGRIVDGDGNGMPGIRFNDYCWTDADGYYVRAGLAAGTYSISPYRYGYSFAAQFSNPATVGPSLSNADFIATALPIVSVTTADGTEGGANGRFTLTRTGATTSSLTVYFAVGGTASSGSDYTSIGTSATIPAGSASVDVNVAIANDTVSEIPDTVTLQLSDNGAYKVAGVGGFGTVTIFDNDNLLPSVSIDRMATSCPENGGSAIYRFSRTGSTASALTVAYAVSGTATNGTDYAALPGTVEIPAGQASADVTLSAIDDPTTEGTETVTLATSTNAAYFVNPSKASTTISINDDDMPFVTVEAVDATATEGNPADTGVFLIRRTGQTTLPLTVYYSMSGSAMQGTDYEPVAGGIELAAGVSTATVVIKPIDDGYGEIARNAIIQLASCGDLYQVSGSGKATVTIADNDASKPVVRMGVTDGYIAEGNAGKVRFYAAGNTAAVTVKYTVGGTAVAGTHYTALSGSVSVPANGSVDVVITPIDDSTDRGSTTLSVAIAPDAAYAIHNDDAVTVRILDNDAGNVIVGVDCYNGTASEAGTSKNFWIYRRNNSFSALTTGALTVNYTMSGTATNGSDYTTLSGTATIPDGADGVNVTLVPVNDTVSENWEYATMSVATGTGYSIGMPSATIWISDNETAGLPTLQFASSHSSTTEAPATGVPPGEEYYRDIQLTLGAASASPVTATVVSTSGSTAMSNSQTTGLVAPYWVRIVRTGNTVSSYHSADGSSWTQQGAAQTLAIGERSFLGLMVCATNDSVLNTAVFDNVTVTGSAVDSATSWLGLDVGYVGLKGSHSIGGGTFTVKGSGADTWSSDEFYFVSREFTGDCSITARVASLGNTNAWAKVGVMIRANLLPSMPQAYTVVTPSNGVAFQWRPGGTNKAFGKGIDYTLLNGSGIAVDELPVTFAPGETAKTIRVKVTDDYVPEGTEYASFGFNYTSGAALGTNSTHIMAIGDNNAANPPRTVEFASASSSCLEASGQSNIMVTLSSACLAATSVDYAVTGGTASSGSDYTLASGTLTFAPGETSKLIPHTIVNDAVAEGSETFDVTLASPGGLVLGGKTVHTITINDDDTPMVSIAATTASATEGGVNGQFTVTRSFATSSALTVNFTVSGTATSGTDYTAVGTSVTIPANQASASVTIATINDTAQESPETAILTLASGSGYTVGTPSAATVTITDDDMPVVSMTTIDDSASEAGSAPATIRVSRTGSTAASLVVNFTVSGTATAGTDYAAIGTSCSIPVGASYKDITFTPVDDVLQEGFEYSLLQLASGSYTIHASQFYGGIGITDNDVQPTVIITSPRAASATLQTGSTILLDAFVTDDGMPGALSSTWTKVSGPGTVTFGTPNSAQTTASFSADGRYVLRLTASDTQFQSTKDVAVSVNAGTAWRLASIGSGVVSPAFSFNDATGVATLTARTGDLWNTADSVALALQPHTGDVTITARVVSITGTTAGWTKAGVMVRDSELAGAMNTNMILSPSNGVAYQWRTSTNGSTSSSITASLVAPYWVRVTRVGNVLSGYYSADGVTWTQQGASQTVSMSSNALVALCLCTNTSSGTATATFDNISVDPAVNRGPVVDVGADRAIGRGVTNDLAATSSDDDKPTASVTYAWEQVSGPGAVEFSGASGANITAAFPQDGLYTLRMTADDGAIRTCDDVTLNLFTTSVSVEATDAEASESGSDPAVFTISRGNTMGDLLVAYEIDGTATNGTDYAELTGTVTIPDGASSVTVPVVPVDDTTHEPSETVTLTIIDGGYVLGDPITATATIADNDPEPVATVSATDAVAGERGVDTATFTVQLDRATTDDVVVNFTYAGTAVRGTDYTAAENLTLPAGSTSGVVTVAGIGDALDEGTETVLLSLASASNCAIGTPDSASASIQDSATVTVAATDASAAENPLDGATYTFTRTGSTSGDLVVAYGMAGSATNGVDYTTLTGSITIPDGQSTATLALTPVDDALYEPDVETAILTLMPNAAFYIVGAANSATVTITSDDTTAVVKANNTTALNLAGSWTGGVVPGSGDIAKWDSTLTGANSSAIGASLSLGGILVTNPAGAVTIANTSGATLTLGAGGIAMGASTQDLSILDSIVTGSTQTWTVAEGRTLNLFTVNAGMDITGPAGTTINLARTGSGTATIAMKPGNNGSTGFGDEGGNYNYLGDWIVGPGVKILTIRNGRNAWGNGTITVNGGTIGQTDGQWCWSTNISVGAAGGTIYSASTGTGRYLDIAGVISGTGTLTFDAVAGTLSEGFILCGNNTFSGNMVIGTNGVVKIGGAASTTSNSNGNGTNGSIDAVTSIANSGKLLIGRTNGYTLGEPLVVSGTGLLRVNSGCSVTINGKANTYTGDTQLYGPAKVMKLANSGSASSLGSGGTIYLYGGGSIEYVGTGDTSNRALNMQAGATLKNSGTGPVALTGTLTQGGTASARTLTLSGANADANTLGGVIANSGVSANITSVVKADAGKWILAGANTYTGATSVNGGTLVVTGSLANTTTTVAAAGALAGTGTIGGATTVNGALLPGNDSIGTLTVGNALTLAGSTVMQVSKSGSTVTADKVAGVTTLTCGGTLTVEVSGDTLAAGDSMQLFAASAYSGTFSEVTLPALPVGRNWDTSALYTTGTISVVQDRTQVITFGPLATATYGDAPVALTATSNAGLTVYYTSSNTSVATVSGGTLTIVGAGSATITARQDGNVDYDAATPVEQTLTVDKAAQSITFGALPAKAVGDAAFAPGATASSGLAVTYTSSLASVATTDGTLVTPVGGGATTITAGQAGNDNYLAASPVSQVLTVNVEPQITEQPVSGICLVGGTLTFSVSVTGTPAPTCQWQSSTDGVTWSDIAGATGANYTTPALTLADSGTRYRCVVTNVLGSVTSSEVTATVRDRGIWTNLSGGNWSTATNWDAQIVANGSGIVADFGTLDIAAATTVTFDGDRTLGGLVFGDTTPSHDWTVSPGSGTLTLNAASGTPTITVVNQTATLAVPLGGSQPVAKAGAGTLVLSASNTYLGNTTIDAGVLELSATGKLYNGGYNNVNVVTVNAGATWRLPNYSYAGMGQLADYAARRVLNGGTIEVTGATHGSGQDFTVTAAGATFRYTPAVTTDTLTLSGNANSNIPIAGALTFDAVGNITVSEVVEGAGSLVKTGAGTLTLSGANTYSGGTTVNAGVVATSGAGNLGSGSIVLAPSTTLLVAGSGNLILTGANTLNGTVQVNSKLLVLNNSASTGIPDLILNGTTLASDGIVIGDSYNSKTLEVGNFSGTANSKVRVDWGANGTRTLKVNQSVDGTFAGVMENSSARYIAFTKAGAATLTLSGANTYTGATAVGDGTLKVNGSLGGTATTVASGAALGGTGTIAGATTVNGTVKPGDAAAGTLTINNTTSLSSTGSVTADIVANAATTAGTDFDRLATTTLSVTTGATVNLVFNATGSTVDFSNTFWSTTQRFKIVSTTNAVSAAPALGTLTTDSLGKSSADYGRFSVVVATDTLGVEVVWTPGPLAAWRRTWFGTADNTGSAANTADPDGDGRSNLLEYALSGVSPLASDANKSITSKVQTYSGDGLKHLNALITANESATDVAVTVEFSSSTSGPWTSVSAYTTDGQGRRVYVDPVVSSPGSPRFFRVVVTPL